MINLFINFNWKTIRILFSDLRVYTASLLPLNYLRLSYLINTSGNALPFHQMVIFYVTSGQKYLQIVLGKKEKLWNSLSLIAEHSSEVIIEDCEDKAQAPGKSQRVSYLRSAVLVCLGLALIQ